MHRPKVWVVKEQVRTAEVGVRAMDYTPAMEYGDVHFITEFDIPLHPNSTVTGEWVKAVQKFFKEYDASQDYIILTGHTLSIFMIGMILGATRTSPYPPKILVWRREQQRYVLFNSKHLLGQFKV